MLVFKPDLTINKDWENLIATVRDVAINFVHTDLYLNNIMYSHGASIVSRLPRAGWISKQKDSHDFFVMGGTKDLIHIEESFIKRFPSLSFTPATICYSTQSVPIHTDSPKNGKCSLVYPLHNCDSISKVYKDDKVETYNFVKGQPIILDITQPHEVTNSQERIWFSIHFRQSLDQVVEAFQKIGTIVI